MADPPKASSAPQSRLVLVRHASTVWSRAGRHTGRTDLPLDDTGRQAAIQLGRRLNDLEVERVYSSPLLRARETCELCGFGERAEVVDDLVEWDYGDYEGLTTAEIEASWPGWELFADGCPGGESASDVGARVDHFLAGVVLAPGGVGDVLCFAHGHVLRVLAARYLGFTPEDGRLFVLEAGRLSTLAFEHVHRAVESWNT